MIEHILSTGTAPAVSAARLRAQRRQVEVNGKGSLPLSARFTFGQSPEAAAVREELKQVVAERLRRLGDGTLTPAVSRELFERSKRLRIRLDQLTD